MNPLSVLIYLIGVLTTLHDALVGILVFGGVGLVAYTVVCVVAGDDIDHKFQFRWQIMYLIAGLLFVLVPNKQTMVMIAASEVGERVANTEIVKNAQDNLGGLTKDSIDLLRAYIKDQTDSIKKTATEGK